MMNIYIGNLSYQTTEQELEALFAEFGDVARASIVKDRDSGRSKGFGFIEMPEKSAGDQAIEALNGKEVDGRPLKVNEARPREERPRFPRQGAGRY